MEKQKIEILKKFDYSDDSFLSIRFSGSTNSNNPEKDKAIIEGILSRSFSTKKLTAFNEIIKMTRTVFWNVEENELGVSIGQYGSPYGRTIVYQNNEIILYQALYPIIGDKKEEYYKLSFEKNEGLNFFASNESLKGLEDTNYITKEMQLLRNLHDIKPHKLELTDKSICTAYRLFYQQNPDFSIAEDRLKAMTMVAFLIEFDVMIGMDKNYNFQLSSSKKIVTSFELMLELNKLAPYGEMPLAISSINFSTWGKQTIETVGQEIRKKMNRQPDPTKWFVDLVKVNHIKRYCLPSNSSTERIAEYSSCQPNTVTNHLKLIRKIDKKLMKK